MARNATQFWTDILEALERGTGLKSNPNYYINKEAQAGEWGNIITVMFERTAPGSAERQEIIDLLSDIGFWAPGDDLSYWLNKSIDEGDTNDLVNAAEDRLPRAFDDQGNPLMPGQTSAPPEEFDQPTPPVGRGTGATGIMSGGTLTRIDRPEGEGDLWAITYNYKGIQHVYTFSSFEEMEATLGKGAWTSGKYGNLVLPWDTVNDGDTWLLGDAAAFAGQGGSYANWFADIEAEAALEAGIRSPGKLGRLMSDPEVQRIVAEASSQGWSEERKKAEIRRTQAYREVYPGIDRILAQGSANPEAEWRQYHDNVAGALNDLGYEPDANGEYGAQVGEMLSRGIDSDVFLEFAPTFVRAESSQAYGNVLSQWTQRDLGRALDFEDWFSVMEGTSSAELSDVVEKATIQFQAEQTSLADLSPEQITRLAELTDFSEQQIAAGLTSGEKAVLALGDEGLRRYSGTLTQRGIVNAAFGVSDEESGLSAEETSRMTQKVITELGIQDDPRAEFYSTFNQFSRPARLGLIAARPEVG